MNVAVPSEGFRASRVSNRRQRNQIYKEHSKELSRNKNKVTEEFQRISESNEEIAESSEENGYAIGKSTEEITDCVPKRVPIVN